MPTPDRWEGTREETSILFEDQGVDPTVEGTLQKNGGKLMYKCDAVNPPIDLCTSSLPTPTNVCQLLAAVEDPVGVFSFKVRTPLRSCDGWLVNDQLEPLYLESDGDP